MQLLIDIGNTRIKWAFADGALLHEPGEIVHRNAPADAGAALVAALQTTPQAIYAINVGGAELGRVLTRALEERFALTMRVVRTADRFGQVTNGYTATDQLGADRWAAVVGAWHKYRRAAVVVDMGTAVTIDLLQADGQHCGGIILPGLQLMRAALDNDTSDICVFAGRSNGPVPGDDWFGRDTLSAVQRGALFAIRAAVEKAADEFPGAAKPLIVLTGGDAHILQATMDLPLEIRPLLVLEGLQYLLGGED